MALIQFTVVDCLDKGVFLLLTSGDARYEMDHLPAPMLRNRDAPALLIKIPFFGQMMSF